MTDLRCPKCGEANVAGRAPLVELIGRQIVCGMCGLSSSTSLSAEPTVPAVGASSDRHVSCFPVCFRVVAISQEGQR
jgi:transcription elongation factor Elf1